MACLSLAWIETVLVWIVVILAILALLRLVVSAIAGVPFWPMVAWPPIGSAAGTPAGFAGFIVSAINIVIWAAILIAMIYFIFSLISCLLSATGGLPSLHPHR